MVDARSPCGRHAPVPSSDSEPAAGWVVSFQPKGDLPPIFCACSGGGDLFDYRDLALALPDNQPSYVFGLPPFAAHRGFPSVQELAAIYVHEARKRQPRGPYRLCGHSFGGLVVYEMAVLLANEGEKVDLLALVDTLHPAFRNSMPPMERRQFHAKYLADRLGKYGRNFARGRIDQVARDAFAYVWHRCKQIRWAILRAVFGRLGLPVPSSMRSDAVILAAAWNRYVSSRYRGRLVLLNAADRAPEYHSDPTLGWKNCANGPIDIHVVPGDHLSIMHPPQVHDFVDRIRPYLTRP